MIAVNFGGALLPGYFAPTRKSAFRMALILSAVWGILAGLVLWYFGVILFFVVFAGVYVGRRYLRETPKPLDDEAILAKTKQTGGFFKVIASHKEEKRAYASKPINLKGSGVPKKEDLIADADLEEEKEDK